MDHSPKPINLRHPQSKENFLNIVCPRRRTKILTTILTVLISAFVVTGAVFAGTTIGQYIQIGSGTPDLTLGDGDLYVTGTLEVDSDLAAKTGGTATFVVAASDASDRVQNQADYVADGTADDVEIQAAIDALPDDGGKVVLSEGTFNISTQDGVSLPSNATLEGQGYSTKLTRVGNFARLITNSDWANGNSQIRIAHFRIDGGTVGSGKPGGGGSIYLSVVTDAVIEDVEISKSWNHGIEVNRSSRITIRGVRIVGGAGDDGISVTDGAGPNGLPGANTSVSQDIHISNCYLSGTDLENSGIEFDDGPSHLEIRGCTFDGASFSIHTHTGGEVVPTDVVLVGNNFHNGDISISGTDDQSDGASRVVVADNILEGGGIRFNNTKDSAIIGNIIVNSSALVDVNKYGIQLHRLCEGVVVSGNTIGETGYAAIWLALSGSNAHDILITGNQIHRTASSFREGIRMEPASSETVERLTIKGNIITGTDYGIRLDAFSGATLNSVLVEGNTVNVSSATNVIRVRIRSGASGDSIRIVNNRVSGSDFGTISLLEEGTVTDALVGQNIGYVTESSGTSTIPSAATSTTVTHGLSVTPAAGDCTFVGAEDPTNSVGTTWIDTYTSTQMTLNVENDPGASNFDVNWTCQVL